MDAKAIALFAAFLMMACSQLIAGVEPKGSDFYVAEDGRDENPGTKKKPFATIERARDAIRELKKAGGLPNGGVTVWIRGGVYNIASTINLTDEDSGTKDAPIVYRACEGEEVRLVGGKEVSDFQAVDDPKVLGRLEESARGKVLQADLKAQGITDFGAITPRGFSRAAQPAGLEVFFQDKPMTLARWPNDGLASIAEVPDGKDSGKFIYDGDRPKRWEKSEDIWLHGYWTYDWADSYEKVKSINTQTREIATYPPHGCYGYTANRRYYALNILEELDESGEWYLDRESGVLYFWPPAPIHNGKVVASLLDKPIISLKDSSYVILRGLIIECTRGDGVRISGGGNNLVAGCTIRNVGNTAVRIAGGTENGVLGCDIYETGDGGVILEGGDRKTLTPAGNFVENCHIYRFSRWDRTYTPAIKLGGAGNRVAHNLIRDAPHSAIILSGNEHIIEFNDIHNVCRETGDAGAFYLGRDFTERGNVVRFNYFHNLGMSEGLRGRFSEVMAIYLDDCASGTSIYGNVFYSASRAVLIGGGHDNSIRNNIFIDCHPCIHFDARGANWASFWFDGRDNTLIDRLKAVNYKQPPYSERYPELPNVLDDEPGTPKGNSVICNIMSGGEWLELFHGAREDMLDMHGNLIDGNPKFVDSANGDFRLKEDSPAYALGFKQIPIKKIGLYKDEYRPRLPVR